MTFKKSKQQIEIDNAYKARLQQQIDLSTKKTRKQDFIEKGNIEPIEDTRDADEIEADSIDQRERLSRNCYIIIKNKKEAYKLLSTLISSKEDAYFNQNFNKILSETTKQHGDKADASMVMNILKETVVENDNKSRGKKLTNEMFSDKIDKLLASLSNNNTELIHKLDALKTVLNDTTISNKSVIDALGGQQTVNRDLNNMMASAERNDGDVDNVGFTGKISREFFENVASPASASSSSSSLSVSASSGYHTANTTDIKPEAEVPEMTEKEPVKKTTRKEFVYISDADKIMKLYDDDTKPENREEALKLMAKQFGISRHAQLRNKTREELYDRLNGLERSKDLQNRKGMMEEDKLSHSMRKDAEDLYINDSMANFDTLDVDALLQFKKFLFHRHNKTYIEPTKTETPAKIKRDIKKVIKQYPL